MEMNVKMKDSKEALSFSNAVSIITESLSEFDKIKPSLNGESYLTDKELSVKLKVSRRTLQEYRTDGIIPYIRIGGKILYRESDIISLLEEFYVKVDRKK
ncbi:helix-turn-helix domain-containing protein [Dysgonomonas sp. GY75]|uniref:helix-turn-helix domain-containing protein n=1 Tax=Dysgonomonas sp. GY75 TaxID=2780419 RepID=UPI001883EFE2|nr:helix-turn-helix domain-containing protein [Dysgonomonas sp. GY75]MBF0650098.1 helix-turn-helix domain-containing protein [Dysgonomonas sp. GY75]